MTGEKQVRRWTIHYSIDPARLKVDVSLNAIVSGPDIGPSDPVAAVVSLSDLQREIAGLHIGDFADSHPYDFSDDMRNGWNEALETVASRLGIDLERKD